MKVMLAIPITKSKLEEQTDLGYGKDKIEECIDNLKGINPIDVYIFSDIELDFKYKTIVDTNISIDEQKFRPFIDSPLLDDVTLKREVARRICLENNYDYLMFIDSDIMFKPDVFMKMSKFLNKFDIVINRCPPDFSKTQIGCSIISREVLKYVNFNSYCKDANTLGEDWLFMTIARYLDFEIKTTRISPVEHFTYKMIEVDRDE